MKEIWYVIIPCPMKRVGVINKREVFKSQETTICRAEFLHKAPHVEQVLILSKIEERFFVVYSLAIE
jgi:hypothetical protein